jgi:hypothetical protein
LSDAVECQSGAGYAERPKALVWQGQRLVVQQVLDRWRLPQGSGFRVLTCDGQVFELFYDELDDGWQVVQP